MPSKSRKPAPPRPGASARLAAAKAPPARSKLSKREFSSRPLNPMQLLFVEAYLVDKNATHAAKAAGYSAKTAYAQGHSLLKHPEVKTLIAAGLKKEEERLRKKAMERGITKERWLRELELIGFANMDDYATVEKSSFANGKDGEEYYVPHVVPKLTASRHRSYGRAIKKLSETKNGIGIELHSKQSALELIGKHYGWVKTEMDLNLPPGGVTVTLTMPSNGREAPPEKPAEPTEPAKADLFREDLASSPEPWKESPSDGSEEPGNA
jgi:hypothetical protein